MKKILLLLIFTFCFFGKMIGQNYTESYGAVTEIAGTGTTVSMTSSASSVALPIGFDFHFWENTYSDFYINPSGAIQFGSGSASGLLPFGSSKNTIVSANLPNNFIAFAWAGGSNVSTANIDYFVSGTTPNRILVINFKNARQSAFGWTTPSVVNVQLQLYEGIEGKIEIHNTNNEATGQTTMYSGTTFLEKIVGIENNAGTLGKALTNTSNWSLNNQMIRFIYCPTTIAVPNTVTPNINSCGAPGTINLSANCSTGTPVWYNSNKTLLTNTAINPTSYTSYMVRCEEAGCASEYATTVINITSPPAAPVLTKSPTAATNPGSQVTLTASGCQNGGIITWNDGTIQNVNSGASVNRIVYPSTSTTYKATCTVSSCIGTESEIQAIVITPPIITATTPISFCSGGTISLSATGCEAAEVNWPDGTHGLTWTSPVLASNASSNKDYSFTATCTKSGSTTVASNSITARALLIPPTPSVASANLNNVAPGTNVNLTATCTNVYYWYWNDGTDHVSPQSTYLTDNYNVNPTITTDYYAGTQNQSCFSPRLKVTINVIPTAPTISATTATTFEAGGTISLAATGCASPKVVSWFETTTGAIGSTGLTYTSTALEANANMSNKVYNYYAKCSDGANSSSNSNTIPITVTFKFGTIAIDNTTPIQICGTAGTSFVVNFTKTGSFASANTRVSLYNRQEFVGSTVYTSELIPNQTSTNSATLILNSNLESTHGGGNPNLSYYIQVRNGSVFANYPVEVSKPIPLFNQSGPQIITALGQTISLTSVAEQGIVKQWYSQQPAKAMVLVPNETIEGISLTPESTISYIIKGTDQNQCSGYSSTYIPITFALTGSGTAADVIYVEGPLQSQVSGGPYCNGQSSSSKVFTEPNYPPNDEGTHYYGKLIASNNTCGTISEAYFVIRVNNIWGVYLLHVIPNGGGSAPSYTYTRLFHTKDPFPTVPGARKAVSPNAITNTVPPANVVWIKDATGEEVNLNLDGATEIQTPLPLTLLSFTGKQTAPNENTINWKTANEKGFDRFEIQKSNDGKKFEKIGEVKGTKGEIYEFVDASTSLGNQNSSLISHSLLLNFYRLRTIDLDGSFTYSKIINIENKIEKSSVGNFYPNPTKGNDVFIDIQAVESGNWTIKSYSQTGQLLNNSTQKLQKGENKVKVDLGNTGFGTRYIQIESKGILEVRKLVKE